MTNNINSDSDYNSSDTAATRMDDLMPHDFLNEIIEMFLHESKTRIGVRDRVVQQVSEDMFEVIERHLQKDNDDVSLVLFAFAVYQELYLKGYGKNQPQWP